MPFGVQQAFLDNIDNALKVDRLAQVYSSTLISLPTGQVFKVGQFSWQRFSHYVDAVTSDDAGEEPLAGMEFVPRLPRYTTLFL